MIDLAQHAGQVTLWRDLLLGTSKWQSFLYINYFTPYLVGYGLALPLSFVMPVSAALKLLLTIAYCGFVAACVAQRARLGGDRRLDWLFIPGFFGYAYALGFYTTLVRLRLESNSGADLHGVYGGWDFSRPARSRAGHEQEGERRRSGPGWSKFQ